MKQTRAHEGSVFTMCALQGGAILSGGGKDRKIIRWSADLAPERECEVKRSLYEFISVNPCFHVHIMHVVTKCLALIYCKLYCIETTAKLTY